MKLKTFNKNLIVYELRNLAGNPFIAFFGIVFPILLLFIITNALKLQVPANMLVESNTGVFITMSLIIPMAIVLLGHSANYSQELEKEIPMRMKLFGYSESSMMWAKAIAQIVVLTIGLIVYTVLSYSLLKLERPSVSSACCLILCLYLSGVLFFVFAHAIASIFKKFGITYSITMFFYFGSMILCGMMGVKTNQLPNGMKYLAKMLPMSYVSSDFIDFWKGGVYNFGPFIQSVLFFGAFCGLLLLYANYKNRRVIK